MAPFAPLVMVFAVAPVSNQFVAVGWLPLRSLAAGLPPISFMVSSNVISVDLLRRLFMAMFMAMLLVLTSPTLMVILQPMVMRIML